MDQRQETPSRRRVPKSNAQEVPSSRWYTNLEMIFTQRYNRTVSQDNTVRFHNPAMQIERAEWRTSLHLKAMENCDPAIPSVIRGTDEAGRIRQV
jgi:hypothetical protein